MNLDMNLELKPFSKKLSIVPLALGLAISACSTPQAPQTGVPESAPQATVAGQSEGTIEELVVTGTRASRRAEPPLSTPPASKTAIVNATNNSQRFNYGQDIAAVPIAPPAYYLPVDPQGRQETDRERYPDAPDNAVMQVANHPVSTFSIDVDTAAYANARRQIHAGVLPRTESVRVEEFINYFNYSYPQPRAGTAPFSITTEVGPSPWNSDRKLMLVGLQGYDIERDDLPPANLVFLIDVSGSMNNPQKLGLLKSSMKMLVKGLRTQDTISIAVYAGAAGQVLAPTSGNEPSKIMQAIDSLHAGGSTNGGAGIELAYALARQAFKPEGINRVILATDGDFNLGTTSIDALRELIEQKRASGVSLTVLGFGAGNYNDALMQELAQKGNGNAAYIDTINEARKVLIDEVGATLKTIAKDVKIQVEFNPQMVSEYRLIGYETRALNREDFNNDRIDAGEIGAGHSVTALYELTLVGASKPTFDELRYGKTSNADNNGATFRNQKRSAPLSTSVEGELAHVKLRYKQPEGSTSLLVTRVVGHDSLIPELAATSENFRFAAAASAFGQILRGSDYTGEFDFADALELARQARGPDKFGYRSEFEQLLRTAAELAPFEDRAAQVPDGEISIISLNSGL